MLNNRSMMAGMLGVILTAILLPISGFVKGQGAGQAAGQAARQAAGPVKVLLLGDKGHHKPADFAKALSPELARAGIEITYTEKLEDLNAQTLGNYDCLMLYANIDNIGPEQEKALLEYVEGGKGFVPVHCASYCFRNSPKAVNLIGGQFLRHGFGPFRAMIIDTNHPAMKGVASFESEDETYEHTKLSDDRRVLMVRKTPTGFEPWTWVKQQGKGRVYYTASGHDARTWNKKEYHKLLEQGIKWAAGRVEGDPVEPGTTPAKVPNYLPGEKWGTQGATITSMPMPLSPAESMKHMQIPEGFEVKLYAAEPLTTKVIAMAWDERGRLWTAQTQDYPNSLKPDGQGMDSIVVVEDTDGDGLADKKSVFAQGLSIPTGMVHYNGGIIVSTPPAILFLKDTDGDGKADLKETLYKGFGISDTHAVVSNLRWGLDNWVWATCGYSGGSVRAGGKDVKMRQSVFRFRPDGSALELVATTSNNTWGLGLDETGEIFYSTANGEHSSYVAIPNRYIESVYTFSTAGNMPMADHKSLHPVRAIRQMDHHGGFTAAAGHAIYTARSFPREYWNAAAFVCEPTGQLLHIDWLEPKGSAFVTRDGHNLIASSDGWSSPVLAEVGPDGAVWVSDWYNFIIQHNPTPQGFRTGRHGAYETPHRDIKHGRIYRVTHRDGKLSKGFDLSKGGAAALLEAMKSDNMFWRQTAQRMLIDQWGGMDEGAQGEAAAGLLKLIADPMVDQTGNNPPAVHALWTLEGAGMMQKPAIAAAARAALKHPSAVVRKNALGVLPAMPESVQAITAGYPAAGSVLADKDPLVRRQAMLALSRMPGSAEAGAMILDELNRGQKEKDRWIKTSATIAAARHAEGFLIAALKNNRIQTPVAKPVQVAQPEEIKRPNLIGNPSFEEVDGGKPVGWTTVIHSGAANFSVFTEADTGRKGVKITSERGADASFMFRAKVNPNSNYKLSGWVRTENLQNVGGALGALLNVHELQAPKIIRTKAVSGNTPWTLVEVTFNSRDRRDIGINCLMGGWGQSRGTAYFDDITLMPISGPATIEDEDSLPGVLRIVATHYAHGAPKAGVEGVLGMLQDVKPEIVEAVLDGLVAGWPEGTENAPAFDQGGQVKLAGVVGGLSLGARAKAVELVKRWGQEKMLQGVEAEAAKVLLAEVKEEARPAAQRLASANKLRQLADSEETARTLLELAVQSNQPALTDGLLEVLGSSNQEKVGAMVAASWEKMTNPARIKGVWLLMRKPVWSKVLVAEISAKRIDMGLLSLGQRRELTGHPDAEVKAAAAKVFPVIPAPNVDALLPLAEKKGDVKLGKVAFELRCAVCHKIEAAGGAIGPDLTGIGLRSRRELLVEMVDPNRSVEGNFKLWTVTSKDGTVAAGRLTNETQTTVEILSLDGKTNTIPRDKVKSMEVSPYSIMPEGFGLLPEAELVNLLEYLASSTKKH